MEQVFQIMASKKVQAAIFFIVTPAWFYVRDHRDSFSWADLVYVVVGSAYVAWSSYLTQEKVKGDINAS